MILSVPQWLAVGRHAEVAAARAALSHKQCHRQARHPRSTELPNFSYRNIDAERARRRVACISVFEHGLVGTIVNLDRGNL